MGEYPTLVPVPTFFVTIHFVGLSEGGNCTNGNIVFRCDSDKNSLVIILYVLKSAFHKNMLML